MKKKWQSWGKALERYRYSYKKGYENFVGKQQLYYMEHLELLRQFNSFSTNNLDLRNIGFDYASASMTPESKELKKMCILLEKHLADSNEIEKCLLLMRWTYEKLLYEEQEELEGDLTALRIIDHCNSKHKTVNCISRAIVLKEALTAYGFYARVVRCRPAFLPLDVSVKDTHAVVEVYVSEMKRWVLLDPTINAYYTDANDRIFSLLEMRRAVCDGGDVVIKFNNRYKGKLDSGRIEMWMEQLPKYLFRFDCYRHQDFSLPMDAAPFIYRLVPKGFLWNKRSICVKENDVWYMYLDCERLFLDQPI